MKSNSLYGLIVMVFLAFSCSEKQQQQQPVKSSTPMTILIQPFKDFSSENVTKTAAEIRKIYPNIKILEPIDFPKNAYYKARNRYRADSTIQFLDSRTKDGFVTIGLTTKDISVTKGEIKDYGIMGLGYRPGKACVASKFRLNKKNADEHSLK